MFDAYEIVIEMLGGWSGGGVRSAAEKGEFLRWCKIQLILFRQLLSLQFPVAVSLHRAWQGFRRFLSSPKLPVSLNEEAHLILR